MPPSPLSTFLAKNQPTSSLDTFLEGQKKPPLVDRIYEMLAGKDTVTTNVSTRTTFRSPNLIERIAGISSIKKEERTGSFERKGKTIPFRGQEMKNLAATAFAEAQNYPDEAKQKAEFRNIINVALNRAVKDGSISTSLAKKDTKGRYQFQGVGSKQYNIYMKKEGNSLDKTKASFVDQVMEELYTGNFPDTTDGATFFSHEGTKMLFTLDHSRKY